MRRTAIHIGFLATALLFGDVACAETSTQEPACSIRPPKGATDEAITKLAKLTRDEAEARARSRFAPDKPVSTNMSGDPEVEEGCLVWVFQMTYYSYHPKKPNFKRFRVVVDAGDGKILSFIDVSPDYMKK